MNTFTLETVTLSEIRNIANRLLANVSDFGGFKATAAKGINPEHNTLAAKSAYENASSLLARLIGVTAKRMTQADKALVSLAKERAFEAA